MALPQQQPYTRGQVLDRSRGEYRSRCWPGRIFHMTLTVADAETGDFTFVLNGPGGPFTITYSNTGTDEPTVASNLKTKVQQNLKALKIVNPTASGAVLDLVARSADVEFSITGIVDPGSATLTLSDETPAVAELPLGVAVALDSTDADSIRTLVNADTAALVFGVVVEGPDLKANNGEYDQADVYEQGTRPTIITKGEVPVHVEHAVAIGDPVYVRKNATGTETAGAFRMSADSTDTVQLTNCRWLSASYTDAQGRLTAMLELNLP